MRTYFVMSSLGWALSAWSALAQPVQPQNPSHQAISPFPAPTPNDKPKTQLEAFQGTSGAVIIKGYSNVGAVSAIGVVAVKAMTFRNAQTGTETKGIVIEVREPSTYSRSAARSFIDYDEVGGLLAGIDYISKTERSVTQLGNFEATYATKGDVKVIVFNSSAKIQAAVSVGTVGTQSAFLTLDKLAEVRKLIVVAQQVLDHPEMAATLSAKPKAAATPALATTTSSGAQTKLKPKPLALPPNDGPAPNGVPAPRPVPPESLNR